MSQVCVLFFVLYKFVSVNSYPGETLLLIPPFAVQTVDEYPLTPGLPRSRSTRNPQQEILHNKVDQSLISNSVLKPNCEKGTKNVVENKPLSDENEIGSSQLRIAGHDNHNSGYRPYPGPFSLPSPPGYDAYQKPSSTALVSEPALPKVASIKPDFSLFKPVTTKVTSKGSGLLSLILALFSGSSSDGLQMNGLKELVINGIVKPLLVAKGGIKTLMSKLSIPIIALILINLEVLVTVWWLWEDCEPQKPPAPVYSYQKPAYNYNNYKPYR